MSINKNAMAVSGSGPVTLKKPEDPSSEQSLEEKYATTSVCMQASMHVYTILHIHTHIHTYVSVHCLLSDVIYSLVMTFSYYDI